MNWTFEETKFLEENYGRITQKQIAQTLGKAESTVCRMAEILDLRKPVVKKEQEPVYTTLQWKKGIHLQGIWNVRPSEVHLGQRS
jgi:hypothetical protein